MSVNPRIMIQRTLFGALAILFLLVVFQTDRALGQLATTWSGPLGELARRGSTVPLLFILVFVFGTMEMTRLLRARGVRPFSMFALLMIVILLILPWWSPAGLLGSGLAEREGLFWPLAGVLCSILGIGTLCVLRNNPAESIRDGGATLLMVLYLGFLGSFGLQMSCGLDVPRHQAVWILLIVILITKSSDIGAYFVGSLLGRHKLIPKVSPGKSVEGAIGGLIFSGLVAVLFAHSHRLYELGSKATGPLETIAEEISGALGGVFQANTAGLYKAFVLGMALSIAAQIGDLFESCFKRDAGIKDSGSVMPHYGGILDLIDSPVYAMPVAWFVLTWVWKPY